MGDLAYILIFPHNFFLNFILLSYIKHKASDFTLIFNQHFPLWSE